MMARESDVGVLLNAKKLRRGVTHERIASAVNYVHETLDTLDEQLMGKGLPRMAGLVELANLSSIIGNIYASGFVAASDGAFSRAGPHKYQDLQATGSEPDAANIEVKVALEKNNPKGHLAKSGDYIVCRYVLAEEQRRFRVGHWKASLTNKRDADETKEVIISAASAKAAKEEIAAQYRGWILDGQPIRPGEIAWIWEVRFGYLKKAHFNISNTPGDSGKTAVVNVVGMKQLAVLYLDLQLCPFSRRSKYIAERQSETKLPLIYD